MLSRYVFSACAPSPTEWHSPYAEPTWNVIPLMLSQREMSKNLEKQGKIELHKNKTTESVVQHLDIDTMQVSLIQKNIFALQVSVINNNLK